MSKPPSDFHPGNTDAADAVARIDQRLQTLAQLGMNLAGLVNSTADRLIASAPLEAAKHLPSLTRALDHLTRNIRQTIAMQHGLQDGPAPRARRKAKDKTGRRAAKGDAEDLLGDLHENLDDPATTADLISRELKSIAADLKRNYGISPENPTGQRRPPADILPLRQPATRPTKPPGPTATLHTLRRAD